MGLKNRGEIKEVGVHDLASLDAGPVEANPLGDLCPDGVNISGVEARGVAGIDISSVSGLSSIKMYQKVRIFSDWFLLFKVQKWFLKRVIAFGE